MHCRLFSATDDDEIEFLHDRLLSNSFKSKQYLNQPNTHATNSERNEVDFAAKKRFNPQDFFYSHRKTARLSGLTLSNVGRTTFTLFFILSIAAAMIVNLNDGIAMPIVNPPDVEGVLSDRFQTVIQFLGTSYDTIRAPFDGKQHLLNQDEEAFVCPKGKNGLQTIGSCFFYFLDYQIHNVIEAIPSYGRHYINVFSTLAEEFAPGHFDVNDGFNSIRLLIQRFVHLQNPATPKPAIIKDAINTTESSDRSSASFKFDPFPDDIVAVKSACISQCSVQTSDAASFIFDDVDTIEGVAAPMTKVDYIFKELSETNLYVCQYTAEDKFGGTWIYFIDSCLCGESCPNTPIYFGLFNGCADLLYRIGIPCTSTTPCTLDRLCPFESNKLVLKATDSKDVLETFLNTACLNICAELAGFSTFEALVALGATASSVSGNALGLTSNAFGGPLGIPAALAPSNYSYTEIIQKIQNHFNSNRRLTSRGSVHNNQYLFLISVGGAFGIAFAASGLSQIISRDNQQFEIFPNGSTPIAAFLTAPTTSMPEVNATSATFAETGDDSGNL